MKAICIERVFIHNPFSIIEKGDTVDVSIENDKLFVNAIPISRIGFLRHFRADGSEIKMTYSDFEYILCNYVFTMAMFYPEKINDVEYFLIIKDWGTKRIYISCNENEGIIHVSFNHNCWEQYKSYEDALDGISNHI